MTPTSSPVSAPAPAPVPFAAEHARLQEIIEQLNAKVVFFIGQYVGSMGYFLGYRWQRRPRESGLDRPYEEVCTEAATNMFVRRWTDRIEAVNNSLVVSSTTGAQFSGPVDQASVPSPPSSTSLKFPLDPDLAPAFAKRLSLSKMKIQKRKIAEVEEELEEGEIREEVAPRSIFRKTGQDLTNARAAAASTSSSSAPTLSTTTRPHTAPPVPAASAANGPSRTAAKENRPIRPLPSRAKTSLLVPNPSPTPKLVGIMASEEISLSTSRIVTMRDILHALSPHYVFPDDMAWTGVPLATDPNISEEELDEYCAHVRKISADLLKALEDEEKLDVEIEIFKNLPSIINNETVPYLPEGYIEKFKKLPIYGWSQEDWPKKNHRQKTFMIVNSLVHLNKVRIGEQESIFAPIKLDGPKVSKAEDAA